MAREPRQEPRRLLLSLPVLLVMVACSSPAAPTAGPSTSAADWMDQPVTPLFLLSPIDVTYSWNEQTGSPLMLPPLQVDRTTSPSWYGHVFDGADVAIVGLVEGQTLDSTAVAIIVGDPQAQRDVMIDLIEAVTTQFDGAPGNDAADFAAQLVNSGDEAIYNESRYDAVRFRLEQRPSGWWLIATHAESGDPGIYSGGDEILVALRDRAVAPGSGEREPAIRAFTDAGYAETGETLMSPGGQVRVELSGDSALTSLAYTSEFTSDDEVEEGLLLVSGVLDRLVEGAGTWAYTRITERASGEDQINDTRSFDGASVHVVITESSLSITYTVAD